MTMRKQLLFIILLMMVYISRSIAQKDALIIDSEKYEQLKSENKLTGKEIIKENSSTPFELRVTPSTPQSASTGCTYWIPRDSSWGIVPFTIGTAPDYRNDDGSSPLITLPFNFCLYGTSHNDAYINNNGNVSFGGPYGTFTAVGFPSNQYIMVAPFWADVDTRLPASGPIGGVVYYKLTPTHLIVQWEHVGYYAMHDDKLNTFQLIITNGNDPIVPQGKNVSFYYKDMQWTTGDASSGTNGFGGTPATVGVNRGNGIDYIQIGTFDHAGNSYDGPYGNADGISFLDSTYYAIDACFSNANVPPIANSPNACDTVYVCAGDTFLLSASYLSPEPNQITTPSFNANGIGGVTILNSTSGNIASISIQIVTQAASPGFYPVQILGIDNGAPVDTTAINVVVDVLPSATANFTIPPIACVGDTVSLTYTGTTLGTTTYAWNFANATIVSGTGGGPYSLQWNVSGSDTIRLVVNGQNGCGDSSANVIQVNPAPVIAFTAPLAQCYDGNSFHFFAGGNLIAGTQYTWTFGSNATPSNSNLQNPDSVVYSAPGVYPVILNAVNSNCVALPVVDSVTVNISPVSAFNWDVNEGCVPVTVHFINQSTGDNNSYTWNFHDNSLDTNQYPVHDFTTAGLYSVSLHAVTDSGCIADTIFRNIITVHPQPVAEFIPTPSEVPIYSPQVNFQNHSIGGSQYLWSFGDSTTSTEFQPVHTYSDTGTYQVMLIVTTPYGCIDTVTGIARVEPEYTFYLPNAFTPNGDGRNDVFIPSATSVVPDNYRMIIFDRWGNELFTSYNINIGWSGRDIRKNTFVPDGTYVYQLEFTDNQNITHKLLGKISVRN